MFENYDDIMTVDQMAKALGIGRNSAYELINSNKVYSVRVGRKILIPKSSIIDFIQPPDKNRLRASVGKEARNDR